MQTSPNNLEQGQACAPKSALQTSPKSLEALSISFRHDPFMWVCTFFPWGEAELASFTGPDVWQREVLVRIGDALQKSGDVGVIIREAVASGHGIGKSALVAWIILWAMSTTVDTRGVVTANTEAQLKSKTWAELAKWHRLSINKHWFDCTATALIAKEKGHDKTWRIDMVPWSERNTEAFAGLHNKGKRVVLIFDEASAIPDVIWEVSEGALTDADTEILWCCFGNPTRNTGRFRECFGKFSHRWNRLKVDSRKAAMTNKELLQAWVNDYGEDSDFVRVRVRGEFPQAGSMQFINSEVVRRAKERSLAKQVYSFAPLVMGVDVARFGDDASVITLRQGLCCKAQHVYRGLDLMELVGVVSKIIDADKPSAVFVDGVGMGAGVVDRLRQLGYTIIDAQSAARATKTTYANKRAEMWGDMRDWLNQGAIPEDTELTEQLESLEYTFNRSNALLLESKDDMKKRGLASPDKADSLALTFYAPVHEEAGRTAPQKAKTSYNMFG